MEPQATLADLHSAAKYVSDLLRRYVCEEAGYMDGMGVPHAFAGSWEVRALSEGSDGLGSAEGFEEIICLTPASNRHLRRAFSTHPHPSSHPPTTLFPLETPSAYSISPHSEHSSYFLPPFSPAGYGGNGYAVTEAEEREGVRGLELHCHPKSGVPMTVIVSPPMDEVGGSGSGSGKRIRIDMLQAGEYGPRKLYTNTPAGNAPLWEIMDLPFLSPTEFVRAKLGCNRESWDLGDISWMMINYSEYMDLNRLSIEEVEEFVETQDDEKTTKVWNALKRVWGV